MLNFRFGSIRAQVQWLAALSAATALAVACAAFALNDARMLSENKRQQLYRYAAVVARNAAPALDEKDVDAAERHLHALRLEPTVTAACLYNAGDDVVATYRRDSVARGAFPPPSGSPWLTEWNEDELALFQPVYRSGKRVGGLFLRSTRDDIAAQEQSYPIIVGVVFLLSLAVAAAFASRMQSRISSPIEALSRAAERVSNDRDYSVRVHQRPYGQLGDLCAAFDEMLDRIEASDSQLQAAHDQLNERVRERTRELQHEVLERRFAESVASGQKRVLQRLATDRPLEDVLGALLSEIEQHVNGAMAAISLIDESSKRLGEPIVAGLPASTAAELAGAPISTDGAAPSRAAATRQAQVDHTATGVRVCRPVSTPDGRLLAVITLVLDADRELTDAETEVVESAVSLASVAVEQRYGEQALREAMHKATAANRAKSDFLANMSHEIRTPLNAILGFAELLCSDAEDLGPQRQGHLQTISSSGRHLLALINDVLDLSKIEAGQLCVESAPIDPHSVLVEVMSLLRVRAVEKGLSLELAWRSPAPAQISTDSARLRQVIVNLVGNAVKFTERGSVRVEAEIVDAESESPSLLVDVIDTGIGIPEEKLNEVFRPFVQADASVTRRFGGTGLGLAICRRLAQAMGGELTVTSRDGQGSTFSLRLPTGSLQGVDFCSTPSYESVRERISAEKKSVAATDLSGMRLLVVDDGETNRRLIELVLKRAGAEVVLAENGLEGLNAALAGSFDAVLMDMQMPVMDGYTAAQKLRDAGFAAPVIALTAHAMKGDEQRCLDAGCTDYLTKPIETPNLFGKLMVIRGAGADALGGPGSKPAPDDLSATPATQAPATQAGEPIASTLPTEDAEFREVVEAFIQKCREELRDMVRLAEAHDWEALRGKAHWLKGSGGTAGYAEVSELASDLEDTLQATPEAGAVQRRLEALGRIAERLVATPVTAAA